MEQHTLTVQIGSDGLLQSVNATAQYQPPQIAAAFANLITAVSAPVKMRTPAAAPVLPVPEELLKCKTQQSYTVTGPVDVTPPTDPPPADAEQASQHANQPVQGANLPLTVEKFPDKYGVRITNKGATTQAPVLSGDRANGIYYRPTRAFTLEVLYCRQMMADNTSCDTSEEDTYSVVAPDPSQVFFIPFNRKLFTQFNVQLGFDRGMLTKFQSTDDSEVLGLLQMPADIVKSILGLSGSKSSAAPAKPAK